MNEPAGQREVTDADFARLLAFRTGLRRFLHWSDAQAKQAGLTGAQYQLLLAIRGQDGRPSVGDVAAHLLLRHNSAVELVDRAEVVLDRRDRAVEGHVEVVVEVAAER